MPVVTTQFTIEQPPDIAWESLKDIALVADCMPGVELTGQPDMAIFTGRLKTRVGAISSSFDGEARIAQRDDVTRKGCIEAQGVDRRGGSRASATVSYAVSGTAQQAVIDVTADIRLRGTLAQFGRTGLLQDITDQLIGEFASTLQRRLTAAPEAAPVRAGAVNPLRVLVRALWQRLRRLLSLRRGQQKRLLR